MQSMMSKQYNTENDIDSVKITVKENEASQQCLVSLGVAMSQVRHLFMSFRVCINDNISL